MFALILALVIITTTTEFLGGTGEIVTGPTGLTEKWKANIEKNSNTHLIFFGFRVAFEMFSKTICYLPTQISRLGESVGKIFSCMKHLHETHFYALNDKHQRLDFPEINGDVYTL